MRPNANAAVSHRSGREAIRRRKAGGELPLDHEARFLPAYAGGKLPHAFGYIRRLPPTSPRPCTASRRARGWRAGNSPAARTKSPVHSACAPRWQITLRVRLRPSASCSGILRRTPHGFPQSMRPPGKGGGLRRFTHEIAALDFILISGGTPASCAARLYSLVLARSITFVGFSPASPRQLFTIYPLFFDTRSAKIFKR